MIDRDIIPVPFGTRKKAGYDLDIGTDFDIGIVMKIWENKEDAPLLINAKDPLIRKMVSLVLKRPDIKRQEFLDEYNHTIVRDYLGVGDTTWGNM